MAKNDMKRKKSSEAGKVRITKSGKWFIARCPDLGLVTQGKTEEEARENMGDLIEECLSDTGVWHAKKRKKLRMSKKEAV